ncbi:MAG: peptidoglycan/xylan/chitin deacetylase (PgdA/CDA1 family) [Candidatus Azotimanducaceae bacterium]|jgi:peptidoglycan/xylan/chitin deacetylase (PgdA/CDA1 family)
METKGGYFVISLDFELMWGMFDKVTLDEYGEHLKGAHRAVPEILALFTEHNIHATWATVGMLMCKNKEELLRTIPREALRPRYDNMDVSAYTHIESAHIGQNEKEDPYHFAPSLVTEIVRTENQEFASHTFSHYYCIDGKDNQPAVFEADLLLQQRMSEEYGVTPTSIIFPRNQTTDAALQISKENNYTAYRGTEGHTMYQPRADDTQSLFIRGLRLLDAYFNISGHNTVSLKTVSQTSPANIPSSRFLRPYSKRLRFLERMRLHRIKRSMTHAAKHNEIFHLWWHPHNFGQNRQENMRNLQDLITHYEILNETYGMQSKNMQEISTLASNTN